MVGQYEWDSESRGVSSQTVAISGFLVQLRLPAHASHPHQQPHFTDTPQRTRPSSLTYKPYPQHPTRMQGAGGMILVDPLYQRAMVRVCRQRKVPVIFDEVFTGIWRLGALSAAQLLGVKPDIACYAKLLTGV